MWETENSKRISMLRLDENVFNWSRKQYFPEGNTLLIILEAPRKWMEDLDFWRQFRITIWLKLTFLAINNREQLLIDVSRNFDHFVQLKESSFAEWYDGKENAKDKTLIRLLIRTRMKWWCAMSLQITLFCAIHLLQSSLN